ncbi:MAG: cysteine desulfurase family protein [Nanoarchaeota archaeon]|nr:cysteine desulfurase family protein [Nanoarchaeota archaeon]
MEVYLDNAASTKVDKNVVAQMQKVMLNQYGNPSSIHAKGEEARELIENTRELIARKLNCSSEEVYFTSGATESNNLAIRGLLANTKNKNIVCSAIEHDSVLTLFKQLEKEGYNVKVIPVDKEGYVKDLNKYVTSKTALVAVMHVNNEIGTIEDIQKISQLCVKNKVLFHCDAVQSFTKVPIDLKKIKVSTMAMSGHKIYGPKGVGALYVSKNVKLNPLFYGGHQENELRPGTENVPGIIGFGEAVKLDSKVDQISKLRDYFIKKLLNINGVELNGPKKRLCNNVNVSFDNVVGETLLFHLNLKNIYVSTGAACSSKEVGVSHVLTAIGLSRKKANSSIRFSLSKDTTKKDIDYVVKEINSIVEILRKAR